MSTRFIRKYVSKLQDASKNLNHQTAQFEDEESHFEPLYVEKNTTSYAGLTVSSSSSEENSSHEYSNLSDGEGSASNAAEKPKKKNKNNRKKKNKNKRAQAGPSNNSNTPVVDEIAGIVAEVNKMLGSPVPPEPKPEPPPKNSSFFKIELKHLNVNNELTRLFGPEEEEGRRHKRKDRSALYLRRQIISEPEKYNFSAKGLNMILVETKDGVNYFKFDHGPEYQKNMKSLIAALRTQYGYYIHTQEHVVFPSNTVEGLIENLDLYFQLDEASLAINALEQGIFFMQSVFDPTFNIISESTRLEYKHIENRPFHIAILKYLHVLTNKACHRTALELAKLLLNLDPSDPLGVIFIMDTLALRAREHKWLVEVYSHWAEEKYVNRLFNVQYSQALAMYHMYLKSKAPEDLDTANNMMRNAIVKFPNVVVMLMGNCKHENAEIMSHEMFTSLPNSTTSPDLINLQLLYAKFIWPRWRESNIMQWVVENALQVLARYKDDPVTKDKVHKGAEERSILFRKYPLEIRRHMYTISAMSELLVEGAVPPVEKTSSFNPYPAQGFWIDIHGYYNNWGVTSTPEGGNVFHRLLLSLVPDTFDRENNDEPENREGAAAANVPPDDATNKTNEARNDEENGLEDGIEYQARNDEENDLMDDFENESDFEDDLEIAEREQREREERAMNGDAYDFERDIHFYYDDEDTYVSRSPSPTPEFDMIVRQALERAWNRDFL